MKYERKGHGRPDRILTRARQPLGQPTPERLEENLRWLIHVTLPPVQAPERLRRRIQAMADAHRAWLDSEQAARDRLREWAGLDTGLTAPEREAVSLLLTTDLQPFEEDSLLRDEARGVMQHLLAALPGPLREALLLQVINGLSTAEIGLVLGYPEGEAAVLLHQARTAIFGQVGTSRGGAPEN